ncbi:MAG: hypothetical protein IT260_07070 [Saprospiraceae bacterium]|nr:hypothetical protein [Saprospiraceae bacterium]
MKSVFALFSASLYGLVLHFLFGFLGDFLEVMSLSFLALSPAGIGFLTVLLWRPKEVPSVNAAVFRPWLTCLFLLMITVMLAMEGTICWIMIFPFFAALSSVGGVIARSVLKYRAKKARASEDDVLDDLDEWRDPGALKTSVLLMLPLVFGALEGDRSNTTQTYLVEKEVILEAPPERVWAELVRLRPIGPDEPVGAFAQLLGLPRHLRTDLDTLAVGGRRTAVYERGLVFDETILELEPMRRMVLSVKTDPEKIPPTVLDEHILVGGRHFSTLEDVYRLEPLPGGRCRLRLSGQYTISTPFNWYAGCWAEWLVSDVLQGVLEVVKSRSEK